MREDIDGRESFSFTSGEGEVLETPPGHNITDLWWPILDLDLILFYVTPGSFATLELFFFFCDMLQSRR